MLPSPAKSNLNAVKLLKFQTIEFLTVPIPTNQVDKTFMKVIVKKILMENDKKKNIRIK